MTDQRNEGRHLRSVPDVPGETEPIARTDPTYTGAEEGTTARKEDLLLNELRDELAAHGSIAIETAPVGLDVRAWRAAARRAARQLGRPMVKSRGVVYETNPWRLGDRRQATGDRRQATGDRRQSLAVGTQSPGGARPPN